MKKMNKKGFTLIEMLVVIAIIAILVSIIIPVVSNAGDKAKAATNAANLRSVKAELVTKKLTDNSFNLTSEEAKIKTRIDNGSLKFYTTDNTQTGGFSAEESSGDILVKWNGLTVQDWAEKAGQES